MQLNPENRKRFEDLLERYPVKRSALLPTLQLVQDQEGFISDEAIEYVAGLLKLTPAQVHDTASFYTDLRFRSAGQHRLDVCTNLSCALADGDDVLQVACRKLGIKEGETSLDRRFTVRQVECLAACGGAAAAQVDGRWIEHVGLDDIDLILSGKLTERPFDWPRSPGEVHLLRNVWKPGSTSIEVYRQEGGYSRLQQYLSMAPDQIVAMVTAANLRGRGGAGFPTGMKWSFLPKDDSKPRYLCVNADEGEPGTFKDRLILERDPHRLIESCVIASHAIRAKRCFIYVRGEFHQATRTLERAIGEAAAAGFLGKDILGTGVEVQIVVHSGAGSYECGEETALLESLEGKRGQPRLKPPFPAGVGLYGCPTIVNNVETLICVPLILERGADWFAAYGTERNGGPKLYCVSGHVNRPGVFEAPMGRISLRQLVFDPGYGGGIPGQRLLKAVLPGGSSTPVLTADEIDVALDFESVARAGSMLGSAATIVMDDSVCMVGMAKRLTAFYAHESCGKCSPCREGTGFMLRLLARLEDGKGTEKDLDTLASIIEGIAGKTLCPFGDAAIAPVQSTLAKFREEYEYHVRQQRCWKRVAKTFAEAKAR